MVDEATLEGAKWYITFILMLLLMTGAALWFKITEISPYKQSVNMILEREGGFTTNAQEALLKVDKEYDHKFQFSYIDFDQTSAESLVPYKKYAIIPVSKNNTTHQELWLYTGKIDTHTYQLSEESLVKKYNLADSSDATAVENLPVSSTVQKFGEKLYYQVNVSLDMMFLKGFIGDHKMSVPINGYVYSRSRDANLVGDNNG